MIPISLITIVVIASLLFGAVEAWSLALVGSIAAAVFVFFIVRNREAFMELEVTERVMLSSAAALLFYGAVQMVPLPPSVLHDIQPSLKEFIVISPGDPPRFHSLSLYPFATALDLARLGVYLIVFLLAAYGTDGRKDVTKILIALAVYGFLLSVFGIIQKTTYSGRLFWVRQIAPDALPFGPFVSKNNFAGFVGMIVPLALGLSFRERHLEKRVLFAFLAVIMAFALFFSVSRGGIVAFFTGVAAFSLIILLRSSSKTTVLGVLVFLFVLLAYLFTFGIQPVVRKFTQFDASYTNRFIAWKATIQAFFDFPVFGSGLGTFQHVFRAYQPEKLTSYWDHPHNDYLEFILEAGAVGAIILAVFFIFAFKIILTPYFAGRKLYPMAGLLASLSTMVIHALVDFNFRIPSNAILFFTVLGLAVSLAREEALSEPAGNGEQDDFQ